MTTWSTRSHAESRSSRNTQCSGLAKEKKPDFAGVNVEYTGSTRHPQPETYWGNVNLWAAGVYDEAKRFAEAMTMAYHRYHGMP